MSNILDKIVGGCNACKNFAMNTFAPGIKVGGGSGVIKKNQAMIIISVIVVMFLLFYMVDGKNKTMMAGTFPVVVFGVAVLFGFSFLK